MRQLVLCLCFALALSACPLRPRYTDFVTRRTEGKSVTFVLTDDETGQPIPNARVELSELKNRLQLVTAVDGTFTVPVEKKYLDENPVFVVTLPAGFRGYRLTVVAPPAAAPENPAPSENAAPAAPPENPAPPEGPPPPALEPADAGSNG